MGTNFEDPIVKIWILGENVLYSKKIVPRRNRFYNNQSQTTRKSKQFQLRLNN